MIDLYQMNYNWENVTKDDFESFIKNYPNELTIIANSAFIPVQKKYIDRTINVINMPFVIAETYDYDNYDGEVSEEEKIYKILSNYRDIIEQIKEYQEQEKNRTHLEDPKENDV